MPPCTSETACSMKFRHDDGPLCAPNTSEFNFARIVLCLGPGTLPPGRASSSACSKSCCSVPSMGTATSPSTLLAVASVVGCFAAFISNDLAAL
eukprot:12214579-Karenia_brevis.AAC.1